MEGRHHQAVREAKDRASETQCVTGHWCVSVCALGLHLQSEGVGHAHPQSLTCILESWQLFKNFKGKETVTNIQTHMHTQMLEVFGM